MSSRFDTYLHPDDPCRLQSCQSQKLTSKAALLVTEQEQYRNLTTFVFFGHRRTGQPNCSRCYHGCELTLVCFWQPLCTLRKVQAQDFQWSASYQRNGTNKQTDSAVEILYSKLQATVFCFGLSEGRPAFDATCTVDRMSSLSLVKTCGRNKANSANCSASFGSTYSR